MSHSSCSVSSIIVTKWLDDRCSFTGGGRTFLFATTSGPAPGPIQPPIQWVTGVKRCVELYSPSPPSPCLHGVVRKHRNNFTHTYLSLKMLMFIILVAKACFKNNFVSSFNLIEGQNYFSVWSARQMTGHLYVTPFLSCENICTSSYKNRVTF